MRHQAQETRIVESIAQALAAGQRALAESLRAQYNAWQRELAAQQHYLAESGEWCAADGRVIRQMW